MSVGSVSAIGLRHLVALLFVIPLVAGSPVEVRPPVEPVDLDRLAVADPTWADPTVHGPWLPRPPLPPTFLRAEVDGEDVVLRWEAPGSGSPASYRIYRTGLPNLGPPLPPESLRMSATAPHAEVHAGTTTFRDTNVSLDTTQYVYVVTAVYRLPVHDPPAPALQTPPPGRSMGVGGSLELPSNPATTGNLSGSCQWYDLNLPHGNGPPEVYPECIFRHLPNTPVNLLTVLETD